MASSNAKPPGPTTPVYFGSVFSAPYVKESAFAAPEPTTPSRQVGYLYSTPYVTEPSFAASGPPVPPGQVGYVHSTPYVTESSFADATPAPAPEPAPAPAPAPKSAPEPKSAPAPTPHGYVGPVFATLSVGEPAFSAKASKPAPTPPGYFGPDFAKPYVVDTGASRPEMSNVPIPVPIGTLWMPPLPSIPNCPTGLEYLTLVDNIIIHQEIEVIELIAGCETSNRYEIRNALHQKIYFAEEINDCCTLTCCGPCRQFNMNIFDNMGKQVIRIKRPCRCWCCCCFCCLQELEVHAPPGTPIGYVKQKWDPCLPVFVIQDEARKNVLKILGPCIACGCCHDVPFDVMSLDEEQTVGRITKHCAGLMKEVLTDVENFGVEFPINLDVKIKAVMIGACFLIDFLFFEDNEPMCLCMWC